MSASSVGTSLDPDGAMAWIPRRARRPRKRRVFTVRPDERYAVLAQAVEDYSGWRKNGRYVRARARDVRALRLRAQGVPYGVIADQLGYPDTWYLAQRIYRLRKRVAVPA